MADDDRSRDDSGPLTSVGLSKEAMESLTCSICLELLYKPVVTACGHMFCFWCGHHGMNGFMASSCPLCRRSFMYFPRVCKLLHFMLMKAYPDEYARRGLEARRYEEEQKMFSPDLAPEKLLVRPDFEHGDACTTSDTDTLIGTDDSHSMLLSPDSIRDSQCGQEGERNSRQGNLTKDDLCCALCLELLYRPVVLNCGDVFCEPCLKLYNFKVHCPACRALHPAGSVLVCLELDQVIQLAFPAEYANKRLQHPAESKPFPNCDNIDPKMDAYLHIGAGCDGCGMCPIIGDRYQCHDCEEAVGYDLCGNCYNNTGSVTGRFNQNHQLTHRMQKVQHPHHIEQVLREFRFANYSADSP